MLKFQRQTPCVIRFRHMMGRVNRSRGLRPVFKGMYDGNLCICIALLLLLAWAWGGCIASAKAPLALQPKHRRCSAVHKKGIARLCPCGKIQESLSSQWRSTPNTRTCLASTSTSIIGQNCGKYPSTCILAYTARIFRTRERNGVMITQLHTAAQQPFHGNKQDTGKRFRNEALGGLLMEGNSRNTIKDYLLAWKVQVVHL